MHATNTLVSKFTRTDTFIPTDYPAMQARFLKAAQNANASITEYPHPLAGPDGTQIATSVALLGKRNAPQMVVVISGTHGAEAAYGSACQSEWLKQLNAKALPDDVAVLMIHLLNPWGAAWMRRVTENNVDLNRNFIDWSQTPPLNEDYRQVHQAAAYSVFEGEGRAAADTVYTDLIRQFGSHEAVLNIIETGQYEFSDGLFFGGEKAEWSNVTLHKIIADFAQKSEKLAFFDLHTGAGPYAYPALLSVTVSDHEGIQWGRDLFGPALNVVVTGKDAVTDSGIAATATGYVSAAIRNMLPKTHLLPLVIECGTLEGHIVNDAVRADNWLHLYGDLQTPLAQKIKADLRKAFIPEDKNWETACIPASVAHFNRVLDAMLKASDKKPAEVAASKTEGAEPAVEVLDLHKCFGSLSVLNGVSLTAQRGEVVSLIGSSGSGKSTFLRCINLLEQPDNGRIIIDGDEILMKKGTGGKTVPADMRQVERIRAGVGMVFQNFNLWPHMSVLENIIEAPVHVLKQSRAEAIENAHQLLKKVGLSDKHDYLPSRLSGGQQQRAAIARTLAMQPKLILLDEPTSALDPELVGEVLRVIAQLAEEGNTMILVTHEMQFAREVSHKIMFLHQGKVEEQGAPAQLFTNPQSPRLQQFLARTFM